MTDPKNPDETFTWTEEMADATGRADADGNHASKAADGTVLDSLRDAIDDLAAMAGPAFRDISVRAADLAAVAAERAAPIVKRVGDATAEASTKAADRSRSWASEQRSARAAKGEAVDGPATSPSHDSDDLPPA